MEALEAAKRDIRSALEAYITDPQYPLEERWQFWLYEVYDYLKNRVEMDYLEIGADRYDWGDTISVGNDCNAREAEMYEIDEQLEQWLEQGYSDCYPYKCRALLWDQSDYDDFRERILKLNAGTLFWF